jgi:molecular chaperone HscB
VHPDRFAAQGAAAQRVAMQWSVRVNEAYQRLKDPLQRGLPVRTARRAGAGRAQHRHAGGLPDAADGVARALDEARDPPTVEAWPMRWLSAKRQMANSLQAIDGRQRLARCRADRARADVRGALRADDDRWMRGL